MCFNWSERVRTSELDAVEHLARIFRGLLLSVGV